MTKNSRATAARTTARAVKAAAAEPALVAVIDPVALAQAAKPVAEKKPKLDKRPTDMGRNVAEIEGNRRALKALVESGTKGVTARELAEAAGFKSDFTTSLVRTLADRSGLTVKTTPGAKNLYRYSVETAEVAQAVAA